MDTGLALNSWFQYWLDNEQMTKWLRDLEKFECLPYLQSGIAF